MYIVISNLPESAQEDDIRQLFLSYGNPQSVQLKQDKHSGLSNGTAYVKMQSDQEADNAVTGLNGSDFQGSMIRVQQIDESEFPTANFW